MLYRQVAFVVPSWSRPDGQCRDVFFRFTGAHGDGEFPDFQALARIAVAVGFGLSEWCNS